MTDSAPNQNNMSLRYAYAVLFCVACINLAWIGLSRVTLLWQHLQGPAQEVAYFFALYLIFGLRAITERAPYIAKQARVLMYGLIFLNIAWVIMRTFNHLTMTTALPLQDALLSRWDAQLGFDWLAYFNFVHDWPTFLGLLDVSYTSLTPLSVLMFILLVVFGLNKRAYFFVEIFLYTAIACTVIGLFFPAEAAVSYYDVNLAQFPNFTAPPGVYHLGHMNELRRPVGAIVLHPLVLPGLVTFPSFHTAAGILMCVAAFRTWLFVPIAVYSAVMIAATPVFGGHYLVDLISGAAIALLVSVGLSRCARYRHIWETRPWSARDLLPWKNRH